VNNLKIYLDIILFENLCMNYIILFATGIVMKKKIKHTKIIISSLLGSIYAIIIYLKIVTLASNIFIKDLLMFYLISFVFGGCSFALIYFINPEKVKISNGVLVGMYPIKVTLIAGAIAFIIIQIAFKITKNKLSADDMICNIQIYFKDKNIKIKTLIDSGNMLKDPISGYPVVVVEKEKINSILPEKLINEIDMIEGGDTLEDDASCYEAKLRIIPFSSLGKQNGILIGIKVDKIKVIFKDKEEYINNVIVGIYNKKITKENKYNALIGLDMIDKG
jgi:stage II sporulation protein GA (sporulation sigma-E factor processing peptidase)